MRRTLCVLRNLFLFVFVFGKWCELLCLFTLLEIYLWYLEENENTSYQAIQLNKTLIWNQLVLEIEWCYWFTPIFRLKLFWHISWFLLNLLFFFNFSLLFCWHKSNEHFLQFKKKSFIHLTKSSIRIWCNSLYYY